MPDPGDDAALASRIAGLLDDEPLRRRMGEASRRRAVGQFDYGVLAARLGAVLGAGSQ
jgi:glycosyltransferase involved in cell wall biosynthesis